ncbi:hypothetical protein ENBRE01_3133 [Enteropsectra breve]|nr:hypothetical protein ENBRE01_3133 [Enteropsectra breve]
MVWGCISYYGKGKLIFVEATLDSKKYVQLLTNNLKATDSKIGLETFIFQQDSASRHTSKLTKEYF